MKAQTSIDPKLISLLGRKLYSSHPVKIVVRELLQNSVDACMRAGIEPKISITIDSRNRGKITTIICDDNGCGMSPEELINDFLCLGGTNKRGTLATGGFGIAKAAIMSGSYWKVETLDSVVDLNDIIDGGEIRKVEIPRQGTRVTFVTEEETYGWHMEEAALMVYTSDVDIKFSAKQDDYWYADDEHAGLHLEKIRMSSSENWEAFGVQDIPWGCNGRTIHAKAFARLNGLTQFVIKNFYDERKSNFLFDLYTNASPDSKLYPMTLSRESLTGEYNDQIRDYLGNFEGEGRSVDNHIRKSLFPDNTEVLRGRIPTGQRVYESKEEEEIVDQTAVSEWFSNMRSSQEKAFSELESLIDQEASSPILKLLNYTTTKQTLERDSRIISVWTAILETILEKGTPFGVGLVGDQDCYACLEESYGLPFFLINPEYVKVSGIDNSSILDIWTSACHEVAHLSGAKHDTNFCARWSFLLKITSHDILGKLSDFAQLL